MRELSADGESKWTIVSQLWASMKGTLVMLHCFTILFGQHHARNPSRPSHLHVHRLEACNASLTDDLDVMAGTRCDLQDLNNQLIARVGQGRLVWLSRITRHRLSGFHVGWTEEELACGIDWVLYTLL